MFKHLCFDIVQLESDVRMCSLQKTRYNLVNEVSNASLRSCLINLFSVSYSRTRFSTHNSPPLLNPHIEHSSCVAKKSASSVTFVIITKNRPKMVKSLIGSVFNAGLDSFSLVLIDDSDSDRFLQTRNYLRSNSIPFKQFSSFQAQRLVEETLRTTDLTSDEKNFIRKCTGLSSIFCGYVGRFLERNKSKRRLINRCLKFAPYSPARNLGIYSALRFFNPDIIFFLDDDCLILYPKKLGAHIQLIGTKINQKNIVAIAGLYKDLWKQQNHEDRIREKAYRILRGMDAFLSKSFEVGKKRFEIMPTHMLGGVLILSKRVFHVLPFDPYVARGEDHAYALDLRSLLDNNEIAIRDNDLVVGHQGITAEEHTHMNVLRDIFRFIYCHAKTGYSFISFLFIRWVLISLINLFLDSTNHMQYRNELWALLVAHKFAKENASEFRQSLEAWNMFLCQLRSSRESLKRNGLLSH